MTKEQIRARIEEVETRYDALEEEVGPGRETVEMQTLLAEMGVLYTQLAQTN